MRIILPNLLFFCIIGFVADLFNFAAAQAEILTATFVLGASELQLGILGAIGSLCYALPVMLTGLLSDRLGRRPLALAGITSMGISYVWGAHADSIQELYCIAALRSLATSMLWPPVMAWMARAVPPRKLPRFLGAYNVSWATGTFFGFWGAGYLFQNFGWTSPFWAAAALAAFLVLFVFAVHPRGGKGIAPPMDSDGNEPHDHGLTPQQVHYFIRQGLLMVSAGSIAAGAALYLFPKVGAETLTEVQISLLNSFRLAGQVLAFYLMGRFVFWHFRRWPVWMLVTLLTAGLAILSTGHHYYQFIAGCILVGFGFGTGFSMCAFYALGLSTSKGRGSGSMETMIGAGGFAGPLLGGAVSTVAGARVGIFSGFLPILVFAWYGTRKRPRPARQHL